MKVNLSKNSQKLLHQYLKASQSDLHPFKTISQSVDSKVLVSWLSDEMQKPVVKLRSSSKEFEYITAALQAQLMIDLRASLPGAAATEDDKPASRSKVAKYVMLAMAGALVVACEGFDSITTMMNLLSVPSLITLLVGLGFSVFSIAVFIGIDLYQVAQNLGVRMKDAPKLLEACATQMNEIKAIRRKIESYSLTSKSQEELVELEKILSMLQKRFCILSSMGKRFDAALNRKTMKVVKYIFSGMAGLLFFGGGFFAGQSTAIFMLGLFMSTVVPTFWPVILFSTIVGLASLCIFWFVEHAGISQLIGKWFGLDESKMELLCDKDKLKKEQGKLAVVKENVVGISKLKLAATVAKDQADELVEENTEEKKQLVISPQQSASVYSSKVVLFSPKTAVPSNAETLALAVLDCNI